ncbi:MAG: polysaccharide deacetylase family protein [Acidimicrobiales bacterium]
MRAEPIVAERRRPSTLVLALVIALTLVGVSCGHDSGSGGDASTEPTIAPETTDTTAAAAPTTAPGGTTLPPPPSTTTPPSGGPAVQIRRGNPNRMEVALTFDAGSDEGSTASILDTLAADGIKASFGLTGAWAAAHPDLVRRIVAGGHQLLNHSYDHPSFTGFSTGKAPLDRAQRLDQLARTEAVLDPLGATGRPWFRPPYGDTDASVEADVGAAGYRYEVMWTVDSLGWKGIPVDQIVTRCLDGAVPGAILLLHVGSGSADGAALPGIIDGLRARGYGFATVAGIIA